MTAPATSANTTRKVHPGVFRLGGEGASEFLREIELWKTAGTPPEVWAFVERDGGRRLCVFIAYGQHRWCALAPGWRPGAPDADQNVKRDLARIFDSCDRVVNTEAALEELRSIEADAELNIFYFCVLDEPDDEVKR